MPWRHLHLRLPDPDRNLSISRMSLWRGVQLLTYLQLQGQVSTPLASRLIASGQMVRQERKQARRHVLSAIEQHNKMKAIFCQRYGAPNVLELREIETPTLTDSEILIRTRAISVTTGDCRVRALRMPTGFGLIGRLALGFSKPRQPILGSELSGIVLSVGKDVTKFNTGDEVILYTGAKLGCHTALKSVSQDAAVVLKPASMSFHEAAAVAASGTTALAFLRRGEIRKGSRVLVVGAAGGVGSAAVMLAKQLGAEVTAVCSSRNIEFVSTLGADRVIDHTKEDFTQSGDLYDVILDASGTVSYAMARGSLKSRGRLLLVSASSPDMLRAAIALFGSGHKVVFGPASWTLGDLEFLRDAFESGAYRVPIDQTFALEQIAEAHAYVDSGLKKGNVVISMD